MYKIKRKIISGLTIFELLIYLTVLAIGAVFISLEAENVRSGTNVERAYIQINKVINAALVYRDINNSVFTNISIAALLANGYNIEPILFDDNGNIYGLDVTVAVDSSVTTLANLSYELPHQEDCEQLADRLLLDNGVSGVGCSFPNNGVAGQNPSLLSVVIGHDMAQKAATP